MVTLCHNVKKSGMGLPHSKTSRMDLRVKARASVMECGSPHAAFVAYLHTSGFICLSPYVGGYRALSKD